MSLIVDINPVPWEILEQVKARLLKNRAKKQKRQPEKSKELRRVMQVDNGILAKQRWEEPSFIGGDDVPFVIIANGNIARLTTYINDNFTIKLNGATLGSVDFSLNRLQFYLFIWSADTKDHESVIKRWFRSLFRLSIADSEFVSSLRLNSELGQVNVVSLPSGLTVNVIVILIEDNSPNRGDAAKIEMKNIQINGSGANAGSINLGFVDQGSTLALPAPRLSNGNIVEPRWSSFSGKDFTFEAIFPLQDD
jgi:hypothetical protein